MEWVKGLPRKEGYYWTCPDPVNHPGQNVSLVEFGVMKLRTMAGKWIETDLRQDWWYKGPLSPEGEINSDDPGLAELANDIHQAANRLNSLIRAAFNRDLHVAYGVKDVQVDENRFRPDFDFRVFREVGDG
jgi:hypothetical protein